MNLLFKAGIALCAGATVAVGSDFVKHAVNMKEDKSDAERHLYMGVGSFIAAVGAAVAVKNVVEIIKG
ncbi:hypothetical protein [Pseudomonas phage D6]|nr:hypothetical protein [Pseudomonas phage D6]